jgi:hypothetical protein
MDETGGFNCWMATERQQSAPPKDKANVPVQPKPGRSGQGSASVIPHLRADQKARAVAETAKRDDRNW